MRVTTMVKALDPTMCKKKGKYCQAGHITYA